MITKTHCNSKLVEKLQRKYEFKFENPLKQKAYKLVLAMDTFLDEYSDTAANDYGDEDLDYEVFEDLERIKNALYDYSGFDI